MPTRNVSLTPEQNDVEKLVEAGEYQNASEAVHDALRALQQPAPDRAEEYLLYQMLVCAWRSSRLASRRARGSSSASARTW